MSTLFKRTISYVSFLMFFLIGYRNFRLWDIHLQDFSEFLSPGILGAGN